MTHEYFEHNEPSADIGTLACANAGSAVDMFPEIKTTIELARLAEASLMSSDEKANEAGRYLAEAKRRVQRDRVFTWPQFLEANCTIHKTQANELIRLATGGVTIDEHKKKASERVEKHGQKKIALAVLASNEVAKSSRLADAGPPAFNPPTPAASTAVVLTEVEAEAIEAAGSTPAALREEFEAVFKRIETDIAEVTWIVEEAHIESKVEYLLRRSTAALHAAEEAIEAYRLTVIELWDAPPAGPPHCDRVDDAETASDSAGMVIPRLLEDAKVVPSFSEVELRQIAAAGLDPHPSPHFSP